MIFSFQPEYHVASCKTLGGAQQFVKFLTDKFTNNPAIDRRIIFHSIIETSGKVSVHSNSPVDVIGRDTFKSALVEFKAQLGLTA